MFVDPCTIVRFLQKNPTRCNSVSKFIISYLYEAQHVSGDTPPIIRSLKLHSMWLTTSPNYTSKQPSTYAKPVQF